MRRRRRIRAKIQGTGERPRISVFRSNRSVFVQLIDDTLGHTVASADARRIAVAQGKKVKSRVAAASLAGAAIAEKAKERGITRAVFDRVGYRYHGAVRAVAEAVRVGGLEM